MTSLSLGLSKNDIIEYLGARLDEDETPDAMDESLEAEILEKTPEIISEMCVGNNIGNRAPQCSLMDTYLSFYSFP